MAVDRTLIQRAAGAIEIGGTTLYPETEIPLDFQPDFDDVVAWAYGRIDEVKKDFFIPWKCRLWGAFEGLSALFPSALLNPVPGTSLVSDAAVSVWGKNGDKITFHNTALVGMPNLYIGVDKNIWAGDVEFLSIIKSGANPEDAAAYFTRTNVTFAPTTAFAKTNFLRRRATLAWSGKTNFTSFEMREGVNIAWKVDAQKDYSANYGTDNVYIGRQGMVAELRGIPAIASANLSSADNNVMGQGANLGVLASVGNGTAATSGAADLTCTLAGSGSHAVVLKAAFLAKFSECFDIQKLRAQELLWRTARGFTLGAGDVVASVA